MKFVPNLILVILVLILVFQVGIAIAASSNQISVNFEVKDTNGNPIENSLVMIQGITNSDFSKNKLTDSSGKAFFTLNKDEFFFYIVYKLSYEYKQDFFSTSENKNFEITLEKLLDDQWFFYLLNNGELEFRFKGLDEDTNYEPGDYIKSVLELRNVAGKNIKLIKDKNILQFVDSQTMNALRAWGNFDISGGGNLESITLKKNGQIKITFSEGTVEICGSNLIIIYMGHRIELSGEESLCITEDQQHTKIPEWILKNKYRFKIDFFYEIIDGIEKNINFTSQKFFINNIDWKPEIVSFPKTDLMAYEEWTYNIKLKEYDESFSNLLDMINYNLIEAPDGMSVDKDEGIVKWTPVLNGDYNVIVRAYHEYFENDSEKIAYTDQEFTLNVEGGEENNPPVITSSPVTTVNEESTYTYDVEATDADEDTLSYSLTQAPGWLSIDSNTGLISGTAPSVSSDTGYDVTVEVSDGTDSATQNYVLTVVDVPPVNNPPVITSTPITEVNENEAYYYDVKATDADGDILTYSLAQAPGWLSINSNTGLVSGTAPEVDSDTNFDVSVSVSDEEESDSQDYVLTVKRVNNAPVITSTAVTGVDEGQNYVYQVNASDSDGDLLTFSLTQAPSWLSIDSSTGLISGTSPEVNVDTDYAVTIEVSDGTDTDIQTYTLTVINIPPANNAPVAQNQSVTTNQDMPINIQLVATDADSDALIYSIVSNPTNGTLSSFNSATGQVKYMPNSGFSGSDSFTFRANDGSEDSNVAIVSITVNPIIPLNNPPVITSTPITQVNENTLYSYQVTATDVDNDTLIYSLTQAPSWLLIDSSMGLISGKAPEINEDIEFNVTVGVSDMKGGNATQNYILIVKEIPVLESKTKNHRIRVLFVDEFYEKKYLEQLSFPKVILQEDISVSAPAEVSLKSKLEAIYQKPGVPTILVLIMLNLNLIMFIILKAIKKLKANLLIKKTILPKK